MKYHDLRISTSAEPVKCFGCGEVKTCRILHSKYSKSPARIPFCYQCFRFQQNEFLRKSSASEKKTGIIRKIIRTHPLFNLIELEDQNLECIVKYNNRKLYNVVKQEYQTLTHLYKYIKKGKNILVREKNSGEDVTTKVLSYLVHKELLKAFCGDYDLYHQLIKNGLEETIKILKK